LYANGIKVVDFEGPGTQTVLSDSDLMRNILPRGVNQLAHTVTVSQTVYDEIGNPVSSLSTSYQSSGISINTDFSAQFNPNYKALIRSATSNGVVNRQIVSQYIFDTTRTRDPPTIAYYYLGPYLPKWAMYPAYQIASIAPDGTITTGKVSDLRVVSSNGPVDTSSGLPFGSGDPPGIFTIPGDNIFLIDRLNTFLEITPMFSAKYAVVISRSLHRENGLNLIINYGTYGTTGVAGIAPVKLPIPMKVFNSASPFDLKEALGIVSNVAIPNNPLSYSAVFFDLPIEVSGKSYRIQITPG
jgi:hypothetical protein